MESENKSLRKGVWNVVVRDIYSVPDTYIYSYLSLKDAVKSLKEYNITEEQLKEIVEEESEVDYDNGFHTVSIVFSWITPLEDEDDETSIDEDYPCKNTDVDPRYRPDVLQKKRLRFFGEDDD